jgi:hypothetical protein
MPECASRKAAVERWLAAQVVEMVRFRLVRPPDASFILRCRTDSKLNRHLSAVRDDLEEQERWINEYLLRESRGQEFYFVIHANGTDAGTVRVYDLRADSFCWGSWIIVPGTPSRIALRSAKLVYELGFGALGFPQSHFDVRKENGSVNRFHRRMGAEVTGEDALNYYYRIRAEVVSSHIQSW